MELRIIRAWWRAVTCDAIDISKEELVLNDFCHRKPLKSYKQIRSHRYINIYT